MSDIGIPRIKLPQGAPVPDVVRDIACARFGKAGVMILEDVISPELVAAVHTDYSERYAAYHRDIEYDDARHVGDRRNMISVAVSGALADSAIYANPGAMPLIRALLGADVILGSLVAVTSLPGSEDQEFHVDMPLLFEDAEIGAQVPVYCVTLVLPLVDMNATNGTTAFFPGSHLSVTEEPPGTPILPEVPVGHAILFDSRIWHHGTPNRSQAPRPVLYNTYQRPWFRDVVNFARQKPLIIDDATLAAVDPAHRHLFDWTRMQGMA